MIQRTVLLLHFLQVVLPDSTALSWLPSLNDEVLQ